MSPDRSPETHPRRILACPRGGTAGCHLRVIPTGGGPATLKAVRRRDLALDAGIAVLTLGMSLAVLAAHGLGVPDPSARHLDGAGVLLAMASTLPLAARRLAPMTVYLVTAAASIALLVLRYPLDFPFGSVTAAYFLSAAYGGGPPPPPPGGALPPVPPVVPPPPPPPP